MKHQFRTWRLAARALVLALVVAAIPLPSLAEETSKPVATAGIQASIAKAAAPRNSVRRRQQAKPATTADKADLGSTSFFKKPVGIAVLAIVGAGIGYMAYSLSNDRIHSVVRQNQ